MNMATREQLSVCMIRQRTHRSCRDCIYDDKCDPDFRRIMTADIISDTISKRKHRKRGQENGYHEI